MLPTTTTSSSSITSSTTKTAAIDQLLPTGGREVSAVVRQVSSGDAGSQVLKVQVEINNRLLELITRAPLNTGDRVTLSRSPGGELQLTLPSPQTPNAAVIQARPSLLLQAPATLAAQLQQALPLNVTLPARVVSSTPTQPGTAEPTSARAATQSQTSASTPAATSTTSTATTTPKAPAPAAASSSPPRPPTTPPQAPPTPAARNPATTSSPVSSTLSGSSTTATAGASQGSAMPSVQSSQAGQTSPVPPPSSASRSASATGSAAGNVPAAGGSPNASPSNGAATSTTPARVFSAQLQQVSQLGEALAAGASNKGTTVTSTVSSNNSPSANTTSSQTTGTPAQSAPAGQRTASPSVPLPPTSPEVRASSTPAAPTSAADPKPQNPNSPQETRGQPARSDTVNSGTSSRESANTPPAAARVSLAGSALLQTLSQHQPRQPVMHLVQLRIESQQVQLISPRPLQAGQQVTLTRVNEQQVQMQAAPPPESPGKSPAAQSALQQALRQALPQQIPLGDALNQLVQLSQTPAVRGQGAIGQLVQSMLSLFSVTPGSPDADQAIQRNLQQGGLLTESQLARSGNSDKPPLNLKQQLGQLLKAAEQLPPEPRQQMQRLVEALQARSTSQQVSSLQAWKELPDGGQERVFRLDIPIRLEERHDNAELTITEQRRPDPDGEYQSFWNVALSFDLHQQGSVDVRLSLHEGWRLQLQFWAEALPTLRRIEQQLDPFTQTLHDKGFIVDHIQARQGKPQQPKLNDIQRRLVDVHT